MTVAQGNLSVGPPACIHMLAWALGGKLRCRLGSHRQI